MVYTYNNIISASPLSQNLGETQS